MDYVALVQTASQATADTLPQTLQAMFPIMHAAALLETEVEMILQALRTATGVSIQALRADWRHYVQAQSAPASGPGAGTAVLCEDVAPWGATVDGEALLNDLSALYSRYVVLPEGAADLLALWTVHTYALDAAQISPRLAVVSPQKRCGKTTLLALVGATVARPLSAANITAAALFRAVEQWRPTMLIDEADTFLAENEELRGVLNAGHFRPTAYVVRAVPVGDTWEPRRFSVWGAVAIALIGNLPSTLADRAVTVRLRRKIKTENVERLRLDRLGHMDEVRQRCQRWAQDALARLCTCDPTVPDTLNDRAADNWRTLCAIAEVVGGDWLRRATHAMKAQTPQELDDEAAGVLLLEDFHQLFLTAQTDQLPSEAVVAALRKLEERPWSEWGRQEKPITPRQVARLLAPFDIKSKTIRVGAETPKGYKREDFVDAWARYLPLLFATPPAPPSAIPPQASNDTGFRGVASATPPATRSATPPQMSYDAGFRAILSATSSNGATVADRNSITPASQEDCGGVADRAHNHVAYCNTRTPALTLDCGGVADQTPLEEEEGTAEHPPAFERLEASTLWCTTCRSAVSIRSLTQLDGTEVYLCNTYDTEVGQKHSTAPPSRNGTQASDDVPLTTPMPPSNDTDFDKVTI